MGTKPAVFFDKDGVINKMIDRGEGFLLAGKPTRLTAPWTLAELQLYPGIGELVQEIRDRDYLAIVVTNQPDVAYGVMRPQCLREILGVVRGLGFDDVFACLHHRDDNCMCRKPKPGMLKAAEEKWGIDLPRSFMVGDMHTDVLAAYAARCTPVVLNQPYNQHVVCHYRIADHRELLALL